MRGSLSATNIQGVFPNNARKMSERWPLVSVVTYGDHCTCIPFQYCDQNFMLEKNKPSSVTVG